MTRFSALSILSFFMLIAGVMVSTIPTRTAVAWGYLLVFFGAVGVIAVSAYLVGSILT